MPVDWLSCSGIVNIGCWMVIPSGDRQGINWFEGWLLQEMVWMNKNKHELTINSDESMRNIIQRSNVGWSTTVGGYSLER